MTSLADRLLTTLGEASIIKKGVDLDLGKAKDVAAASKLVIDKSDDIPIKWATIEGGKVLLDASGGVVAVMSDKGEVALVMDGRTFRMKDKPTLLNKSSK